MSDFIFYWIGLTGLTGYFFGFPDESQKFQSPSANEKVVAIILMFIKQFGLPASKIGEIISRPKGGIVFRHFLLESGEEKKSK